MKLQVGKPSTGLNQEVPELTEILKDGSWVKEKNNVNLGYQGIGRFDPIAIREEDLSELLLCLNAEKLGYSYKIEKHGNKYYAL